MYNDKTFTWHDSCIFNIVKEIGIVPCTNSTNQYGSYKLLTDPNFKKQLELRIKRLIPRNIFVCICRKIFGNDI